MPKKKKAEENKDITIDLRNESGLAEFVKRPVASDKEVEAFEESLAKQEESYDDEYADDEEVEESLAEIYQDDNGDIVNVQKMIIGKKRGFLWWFLATVITLSVLSVATLYVYNLYLGSGTDSTAVDYRILGETEVVAGEEFFYELTYQNQSNFGVNNVVMDVTYPDNFTVLDASVQAANDSFSRFEIKRLPPNSRGEIKIKGMFIGAEGYTGVVLSQMRYTPDNFSSEFKKEASITTRVRDVGIDIDIDYIPTVLVGNEVDVRVNLSAREQNFLSSFRVSFEPSDNIEIINKERAGEDEVEYSVIRPGVWQVENLGPELKYLPLYFRFKDKINEKEPITITFDKQSREDQHIEFYAETLEFDVLKSDLNLTLIINGERDDQGVDFGETLNYSIVYINKGETELKDVIIMAVLESDFLDWTLLDDPYTGVEKGNTIAWSAEEIAELEVIGQNEEGTIDFSIPVVAMGAVEEGREYQVRSYAQYSVGVIDEEGELTDEREQREDNRSNIIVNRLNSDLTLDEQVRYFDENNLTVGNGPLPFVAGEETSVRVYWSLTNNLHELKDAKVELALPEYADWDDRVRTTVGEISWDGDSRLVTWNIGRLPISVFRADAEFSLTVTPREEDKGKIIVVKPAAQVSAVDSETEDKLEKAGQAKTSKLEDDDIAERSNDGVVR